MRTLAAWRLPLRMARRDALRHRGRSALALLMIMLPVLAVTTAAVLMKTQSVSGVESIDRRMGSAQALVTVQPGVSKVYQGADPDGSYGTEGSDTDAPPPSAAQVAAVLGGAPLVELRRATISVASEKGRADAEATEVDLADPVTRGLFDLTSGRWPAAAGEVVVNRAMLDKGYAVGDRLDLTLEGAPAAPRIVGVAESTTIRSLPTAAGPLGSLGVSVEGSTTWLVKGAAVPWPTVRALNDIGATVASRAVIEDPPPASELPAEIAPTGGGDGIAALVGLIVTMALIEVVLLAGPSFAVGARKQQRSLALLAASGGTPSQARRVILAGAVVLGGAAAVLGVGLGIALARLLEPLLQRESDSWLGPFDVPWLALAGVAAFGMVSAFLAALVPAWIASRQDVVAVLAGRRGDRAPSLRSPILGVALVGLGVAITVSGAARGTGGEMMIALGAIPSVLGMILLVPVVLVALAKVSGRLPLALRYAVRDATRHRTRTVPAVAAVAATVAGVVALGIGMTSDERENRETYTASLPMGAAVLTDTEPDADWGAIGSIVTREAPAATTTAMYGVATDGYVEITEDGGSPVLTSSGNSLGAGVMVDDAALPIGLRGVARSDRAAAATALAQGRPVVFASVSAPEQREVTMVARSYSDTGDEVVLGRARATADLIPVGVTWLGPQAVVPTAVADQLGGASQVSLVLGGPTLTRDQESAMNEALAALGGYYAGVYVERGYQADSETVIAQVILIGLGATLMLGGTLTATFLALSDARPDLATLSAVGASPRTRRRVAAAYAVVVGGVGAVLGAVVGFIPGLAVVWPLTSQQGNACVIVGSGSCVADGTGTGPFLDVPWLMILALVVVLPLVTALVVGVFARSRLPLVARLG